MLSYLPHICLKWKAVFSHRISKLCQLEVLGANLESTCNILFGPDDFLSFHWYLLPDISYPLSHIADKNFGPNKNIQCNFHRTYRMARTRHNIFPESVPCHWASLQRKILVQLVRRHLCLKFPRDESDQFWNFPYWLGNPENGHWIYY